MSSIANVTLSDFEGGTQIFVPIRQDAQSGVITYAGSGPSYDAKPVLTLQTTYPRNGSNRLRERLKISIPILDPSQEKKVDEVIFTCEVSLPKNSSLVIRNDLFSFARDITQHDVFRKFIQDFETPI